MQYENLGDCRQIIVECSRHLRQPHLFMGYRMVRSSHAKRMHYYVSHGECSIFQVLHQHHHHHSLKLSLSFWHIIQEITTRAYHKRCVSNANIFTFNLILLSTWSFLHKTLRLMASFLFHAQYI